MNVCEHLTVTARLFPDRDAIRYDGESFSYRCLDQRSITAANFLQEQGVGRGDRVALMLPNSPAFVVCYYAALRIGAIVVSVSTRLVSDEVLYLIEDCECRVLVTDHQRAESLSSSLASCPLSLLRTSELGNTCGDQEFPADNTEPRPSEWIETDPNEPALILYTSGTTGFAKGATLSHQNVRATVHAFNHLCRMGTEDRILLAVPLFHCYGQNALLNSGFNVGATLVLQNGFDLQESRRLIADEQVTQLYCVPTTFRLLAEYCTQEDLSSVNYCFSAAATLPIQVSHDWQEKFGMPIYEGYGLTETAPFASYNHPLKYVPGSIGVPVDLVEMKIIDPESGEECPPGKPGEIVIRGPNVMLGYWNRPEATADAIRDGWFHSGDIGRCDENGYFYIVDRVKDMIAVGGMKVFPAEVERVLLDHEQVAETAVVGVPDDVLGETVGVFVVRNQHGDDEDQGAFFESLRSFAREHLADYKVPQQILEIEELPRNPAGKVLKTKLRELLSKQSISTSHKDSKDVIPADLNSSSIETESELLAQLGRTHLAARQEELLKFLQRQVQEILDDENPPDADDRFIETGMDSLMIVDLHERLQAELGNRVELPVTLIFDYPRLSDLAGYLHDSLTIEPPDREIDVPTTVSESNDDSELRSQVELLSEDEALEELKKELDL